MRPLSCLFRNLICFSNRQFLNAIFRSCKKHTNPTKPLKIQAKECFRTNIKRKRASDDDKKNINRLMSEELLSNDRRVEKHLTPPGFEQLTSRSITRCTDYSSARPLFLLCCNRLYTSNKLARAIEITQKWRTKALKKSLEKSKNVLEENRKMVERKICIKRQTRLQ